MERRKRGDTDVTARDSDQQDPATSTQGNKHESQAGQQVATGAGNEENWSELSNLRVAGDSEETAQTRSSSSFSAGSNRHKIRRTSSYAHPTTPQDDSSFSKSSLSFILDDQAASAAVGGDVTSGSKQSAALIARSRSTGDLTGGAKVDVPMALEGDLAKATQSGRTGCSSGKQPSTDGKRRARRPPSRICKHEGCEQYVVDQGLCVRHGKTDDSVPTVKNGDVTGFMCNATEQGGKRCQTLGCTSRAKHQGRCWKHGGSTECKVPSCINRAKSRGFCWSHGGGTKCKAENCEKIAISNGLCWAHGGGKRCAVEGCMRQAYERTDNLCNNHYQERQRGGAEGKGVAHLDDEEKPSAPSMVQ